MSPVSEGYRLSPPQRRVWSLQQSLGVDLQSWCSVVLPHDCDEARSRMILEQVISGHEVFHYTFHEIPGSREPIQAPGDRAAKLTVELDRESDGQLILNLRASCLIADAATLLKLADEFRNAYTGLASPANGLAYGNVAEWLNEFFEDEESRAGTSQWRPLPSDILSRRIPYTGQTKLGARVWLRHTLSHAATSCVRKVCEAIRVPAESVLLACWALLLARRVGQETIALGLYCDGRRLDEVAQIFGPLSRVTPVEIACPRSQRAADLVRQVESLRDHHTRWQEYFDCSTEPLPYQFAKLPGSTAVQVLDLGTDLEPCDLRLVLEPGPVEPALRFESYSGDWHPSALCGLASEFETLAASLDANRRTGGMHVVSAPRIHALVSRISPHPTLAQGVGETAGRTPSAVAARCGGATLTFIDWDSRAAALSAQLRSLGVGPGSVVPILFTRSPEFLIALLAVWKAGGAFAPLDPEMPQARIRTLLASCRAPVVLACSPFEPHDGTPVLPPWQWRTERTPAAPAAPHPSELAYVIFTSGSTGEPKAVAVSHESVACYSTSLLQVLALDGPAHFGLVSTLAADLGYTSLFASMASGGCLHLIGPEEARSPEAFRRYVAGHPLDVLKIVPSHFAALIGEESPAALLPRRCLILGGEPFPAALAARIRDAGTPCRVLNHYGPTECTVGALVFPDAQALENGFHQTIPIGRPLSHVTMRLLDEWGMPVPRGVPGEIHLGGPGLARGYLHWPDTTAARFVPDPFAIEAGARLYRTGDLARELPDGSIEFLGRMDNQVKLHGYRIELGEIEAALLQHPGVQQAAVLLAKRDTGDALMAFVAPRPENARAVRHALLLERGTMPAGARGFTLANGVYAVHRSRNECDFLFDEIFQQDVYFQEGITLPPGDACVLDAGANAGFFSIRVEMESPGARVYAFEPIPATFELLEANSHLHSLNVSLWNVGLGESSGFAAFTHYPAASVLSGRHADSRADQETAQRFSAAQGQSVSTDSLAAVVAERMQPEIVTCPVRTLSEIIAEEHIERIDLLKVDVQGSELAVLRGIADHDWRRVRQIVVEVEFPGPKADSIRDLLLGRGYDLRERHSDARVMFYARRTGDTESTQEPAPPVERWSSPRRLCLDLRKHLQEHLPAYMIPAGIHLLREFPLTRNGKVDRAALLQFDRADREASVPLAPRNESEAALAGLWSGLLRRPVGIGDNFFELGGDSILAIQVAARAPRFGLSVRVEDVLRHPTIAELAPRVRLLSAAAPDAPPAEGEVPLTPIQRWFVETDHEQLDRRPQAMLLEVPPVTDEAFLRRALSRLMRQHDSLRLRLQRSAEGWRQFYAPPELVALAVLPWPSGAPVEEGVALLAERCAPTRIEDGPAFAAALLRRGPDAAGRLLLVAHRLVIDAVSWRVLLSDLQYLLSLGRADDGSLPPTTATFQQWATQLVSIAQSGATRNELDFWLRQNPTREPALTAQRSMDTTEFSLEPMLTAKLLRDAPREARASVEELLLSGLAISLRKWQGPAAFTVDLEGHGRAEELTGLELHRTIGWFTSLYPLRIEIGDEDEVGALLRVKQQIRSVPNGGIGYGLLRYLNTSQELEDRPAPLLNFNYLGQFDGSFSQDAGFRLASEPVPPLAAANEQLPYALRVLCGVLDGQLRVRLEFDTRSHSRASIESLGRLYLDAIQSLISTALRPGSIPLIPADFGDIELSERDFSTLLQELT